MLASIFLVASVTGTAAAGQDGTRQVLGVLSVQGDVWTQEVADGAREKAVQGTGTPLLASTRIRTGKDAAALLTLGRDGIVGLRGESRAVLGARGTDGTRIDLGAGEALVRLPQGSPLTIATSTATVRTEELQKVATGALPNEASIRLLPDGQTVVRVQTGSLRVESRRGETTLVSAGEQTAFGEDGRPRIVAASTAGTPAAPAAPVAAAGAATGGAGIFGSDAMVAGLAGIAVVGGTLGGLGAAGELGNGDDGDDSVAAAQGSPYKPKKPKKHGDD